ncbi:MAG: hypothetical protein AAB113_12555 [Candidatus Eisenbacteria bacterium]
MTQPHAPRTRPLVALGLPILALALSGCFNPFSPRIAPVLGFSKPAPVPSSASNLLRLFEWCYNNKAIAEYREIFTDDYRFFFSPLDSAGAPYRGERWTREDELIYATQLFVGGSADQLAASSIRLALDKNFFVYPDPNYAQWDVRGRWHKNIRTHVFLNIQTADGNSLEISGAANFYMVRGDSAVIPEELRLRGFGPDSNRWYIRRWDDETANLEPGARAVLTDAGARQVRQGGSRWTGVSQAARSAGRDPLNKGLRGVGADGAVGPNTQVVSWGYVKVAYR